MSNKEKGANKMRICKDCKNGEHDNYTEDVKLVYVRDPDTKKIIRRAYMCSWHRDIYEDDGYEVHIIK